MCDCIIDVLNVGERLQHKVHSPGLVYDLSIRSQLHVMSILVSLLVNFL